MAYTVVTSLWGNGDPGPVCIHFAASANVPNDLIKRVNEEFNGRLWVTVVLLVLSPAAEQAAATNPAAGAAAPASQLTAEDLNFVPQTPPSPLELPPAAATSPGAPAPFTPAGPPPASPPPASPKPAAPPPALPAKAVPALAAERPAAERSAPSCSSAGLLRHPLPSPSDKPARRSHEAPQRRHPPPPPPPPQRRDSPPRRRRRSHAPSPRRTRPKTTGWHLH